MLKKKDYELIAEAYARIETINECWEKMSAPQKSKVEDILKSKSGYKIGDHAYSDEKKTVTLTHELGSDVERDIIVDDKGEEVVRVHKGPHNESVESQATFDPAELTRKFIDDARRDFTNHKAHGSLAALKHLKGNKEGIIPDNPHVKGSPAAQNWQDGWNEIMKMDDEAGKKEVEAGKVHTAPAGAAPGYNVIPNAVKESAEALEEKKKVHNWNKCDCESCKRAAYIADHVDEDEWPSDMKSDGTHLVQEKKMACGKGCTCEKCPNCMPKKKSLKKALEEAYDQVSKFIPITADRAKYIAFPDDGEAYEVDPFKKVDMKYALKDRAIKHWAQRDVIVGEDIVDLYPNNKSIDTTTWYIVPAGFKHLDMVHTVLVGYIASL